MFTIIFLEHCKLVFSRESWLYIRNFAHPRLPERWFRQLIQAKPQGSNSSPTTSGNFRKCSDDAHILNMSLEKEKKNYCGLCWLLCVMYKRTDSVWLLSDQGPAASVFNRRGRAKWIWCRTRRFLHTLITRVDVHGSVCLLSAAESERSSESRSSPAEGII